MRNLPHLVLIGCCHLIFFGAFAQIETDRPSFTESPNVVPTKAIQVETGFIINRITTEYCRTDEIATNVVANTTLIRYGIRPNVELRLNWQYNANNLESRLIPFWMGPCNKKMGNYNKDTLIKTQGFSPFFVGFKTNVYKSDRMSLGFLGHLYLPFSASSDFSISNYGAAYYIPVSFYLNNRWTISSQISMQWDGNSTKTITGYTLSLGAGLTEKLGFFVEPYGYLIENQPEEHHINGGFTYLVKDNLQLDLTSGVQINGQASNAFGSCGVSYLLERK